MQPTSFRVSKFRNVVDSGEIAIDPEVTCLVGKNEAGKSCLLEALYLFNPAYGESFSLDEQYPRWLVARDRRQSDLDQTAPIEVNFELEPDDLQAISAALGENVITDCKLTVQRRYGGGTIWTISYSEQAAIENLLAAMPTSVAGLLEGTTELDQLNAQLSAVEDSENESRPCSDDIAQASEVVESRGLDDKSVWQTIVNILKARLPVFFRFTNYSTLPGRVDFRELAADTEDGPGQSSIQTARALLQLTGTDLDQLTSESYELRRSELEAVQIDLTNQVFEYWKQNPDLEVVIDVDKETVSNPNGTSAVARYLDIRLSDRRTGYSWR